MPRNTPPPIVTSTDVKAYAHCVEYMCQGYEQQEVQGVRTLTEWNGASLGSDSMFAAVIFTSTEEVNFADSEDARCEFCGGHREISATPRPTYQRLSGHPQDGLLKINGFDPGIKNTETDQKMAEMMAESNRRMAELEEKLAALTAATEGDGATG